MSKPNPETAATPKASKVRTCACGQVIQGIATSFGYVSYPSRCPDCETKERIEREQKMAIAAARERTERRCDYVFRIRQAIPKHYWKAKLGRIKPQTRQLLIDGAHHPGLFLFGGTGTGKTFGACALARQARLEGRSVQFQRWDDLLLTIRKTFDSGSGSESGIMESLLRPDLLIVDDLGTTKSSGQESDFACRTLLGILDGRINSEIVTIITSNRTPAQIEAAFGERVGSRLALFSCMKMAGQDRRKAQRKTV
jgi:DNA replication protein DnaC